MPTARWSVWLMYPRSWSHSRDGSGTTSTSGRKRRTWRVMSRRRSAVTSTWPSTYAQEVAPLHAQDGARGELLLATGSRPAARGSCPGRSTPPSRPSRRRTPRRRPRGSTWPRWPRNPTRRRRDARTRPSHVPSSPGQPSRPTREPTNVAAGPVLHRDDGRSRVRWSLIAAGAAWGFVSYLVLWGYTPDRGDRAVRGQPSRPAAAAARPRWCSSPSTWSSSGSCITRSTSRTRTAGSATRPRRPARRSRGWPAGRSSAAVARLGRRRGPAQPPDATAQEHERALDAERGEVVPG